MLPTQNRLHIGDTFTYKRDEIRAKQVTYYSPPGTVVGTDYDIDLEISSNEEFTIIDNNLMTHNITVVSNVSRSDIQMILRWEDIKNDATLIDMKSQKSLEEDEYKIYISRQFHFNHNLIDGSAGELINWMSKDSLRDLRRLAMYGVKFVILDRGEYKEEDVVQITTTLDFHGTWIFPARWLCGLIKT